MKQALAAHDARARSTFTDGFPDEVRRQSRLGENGQADAMTLVVVDVEYP